MKAVLMSIQPKWVEKIASGEKMIEVRKSRPKLKTPFKVYIYETKGKQVEHLNGCDITYHGRGKVIGEFVCDKIEELESEFWDDETYESIGVVRYDEDSEEKEKYIFATNGEGNWLCQKACLKWEELRKYIGQGINTFYALNISQLKIYEKPKEVGKFYVKCTVPESKCKLCDNCYERVDYYGRPYAVKQLKRPPQSWCYVEK